MSQMRPSSVSGASHPGLGARETYSARPVGSQAIFTLLGSESLTYRVHGQRRGVGTGVHMSTEPPDETRADQRHPTAR